MIVPRSLLTTTIDSTEMIDMADGDTGIPLALGEGTKTLTSVMTSPCSVVTSCSALFGFDLLNEGRIFFIVFLKPPLLIFLLARMCRIRPFLPGLLLSDSDLGFSSLIFNS